MAHTRRSVSYTPKQTTIAMFADFHPDGRRPIYLCSLPVLIIGSLGVALSQNIPNLLFWRFLQSVGAAPAMVVGAGVTGDIYKLEERGRAMGIFFGVCSALELSTQYCLLKTLVCADITPGTPFLSANRR